MSKVVEKLEKILEDFEILEECVIFHSSGETLNDVSEYVEDNTMIINAKLRALVMEMKQESDNNLHDKINNELNALYKDLAHLTDSDRVFIQPKNSLPLKQIIIQKQSQVKILEKILNNKEENE